MIDLLIETINGGKFDNAKDLAAIWKVLQKRYKKAKLPFPDEDRLMVMKLEGKLAEAIDALEALLRVARRLEPFGLDMAEQRTIWNAQDILRREGLEIEAS